MEEMEKKWAEQNARIMQKYPAQEGEAAGKAPPPPMTDSPPVSDNTPVTDNRASDEPQLPLPPRAQS